MSQNLVDLEDAIKILTAASKNAFADSEFGFFVGNHAATHLKKQVAAYFQSEAA